MINACVSHELRNPLNSIKALNYEKQYLYDLIDKNLKNEDFSKASLIKKLKLIMRKL
jgi:signal transduction histidine kinase